jgi:hypothetical protein
MPALRCLLPALCCLLPALCCLLPALLHVTLFVSLRLPSPL